MPRLLYLHLLTLFVTPHVALAQSLPEPLDGLVAAERAFAADTRVRGIRDGFLGVLAKEGVLFRPQPVNGREFFEGRAPTPTVLLWEPTFAEVSSSGDLGFTTGPWSIQRDAQSEPEGWGHFVSVWIQEEGNWRLLVDLGIPHDAQVHPDTPTWVSSPASREGGRARGLQRSERKYNQQVGADPASAWGVWLSDDGRILREGYLPAVGEEARKPLVKVGEIHFEERGSGISQAGDLGYAWGHWQGKGEDGYYLHEWRHTESGWKLALDVNITTPPPPPPPATPAG